MIKISESLSNIIHSQPYLSFGFNHGLFNLTKLAHYLKPFVEVHTKKEVKETALLMNLSRLAKGEHMIQDNTWKILNLSVHSNLVAVTVEKNHTSYTELQRFISATTDTTSFTSLNTSTREITLIISADLLPQLTEILSTTKLHIKEDLSSISVHFEVQPNTPGLLYYLIQHVTVQNINIAEISSTNSELIFYVSKKDVNVVFETFNQILNKKS